MSRLKPKRASGQIPLFGVTKAFVTNMIKYC